MPRLIPFIAILVLAGCAGHHQVSYSDSSGAPIESDRESCVRSCNDDFDRCSDTDSAHRNASNNAPSGLFGGSAVCREELKDCLPRCRGR